MGDKRKQSFLLDADVVDEIRAEADRQDRSFSWMMQQAWRLARQELQAFPSPAGERDEVR